MKLTKTLTKPIKSTQKCEGLLRLDVEHEIKSTTAKLSWDGPTISPEVWHTITSFFQWTYDTTKSESQVRLYVNPLARRWAAWAYPQEAGTGMSARELDTDASKEQRAQFSDADGWTYFGTVHHHCSCGAFQSGVDESNEKAQDGLHITLGKMDENRMDMHARFYIGGLCFEPDMSKFWAIGRKVANLIPSDLRDRVARYQMCEKVKMDFPDAWKTNLIEVKRTYEYDGGLGYRAVGGYEDNGPVRDFDPERTWATMESKRISLCADDIMESFYEAQLSVEEASDKIIELVDPTGEYRMMLEAFKKFDVKPLDVLKYIIRRSKDYNLDFSGYADLLHMAYTTDSGGIRKLEDVGPKFCKHNVSLTFYCKLCKEEAEEELKKREANGVVETSAQRVHREVQDHLNGMHQKIEGGLGG